jgi:hypothetical protein
MDLLRTPAWCARFGEFRERSLVKRPQLPHRLVPIPGDLQPGDSFHPSGAHTGQRV